MRLIVRFRLLHLILLMTVIGVLTSLVAPFVVRHYQEPHERFNADLALPGYALPRMIALSTFDTKNHVGFCLYYVLAYRRDDKYLLRHAYLDPGGPWYGCYWQPLSSRLLKDFGYKDAPKLDDRLLDHRPTEDELALFIEPLKKIIDEPEFVLEQLNY